MSDSVQALRWPAQADARDARRWPDCLWLLPVGELAPELAPGEDWIRLPADERDVHARLQRLADRVSGAGPLGSGSVRVDHGVVSWGGARLVLAPIEGALLECLSARARAVVRRDELALAGWGDASRTGRQIDSRVFSLRRRIEPIGLAIHTVRGRGYLLERAVREHPGVPRGWVHAAQR